MHMGRIAALQLHGTGFHREPTHIAVVTGKRPGSVISVIVFHRQLSFTLTAAFIHETAAKSPRAGVGECGKPGSLLSQRSEVTDTSPLTGAILIDDSPLKIMPIEIQQATGIAEREGITRHGFGLELTILHQHQNGDTALQPNGGSSITIRAIQARFADVTQRATRDIAVIIVGDIILRCTAAHAQNSFIITAAGNGHGAFPHLAPFFCGSGRQLQREFCALVNDKACTVESGCRISFGEFPFTGFKGHGTGTHIHGILQLQRLHMRRIRCPERQAARVFIRVGRALARVLHGNIALREHPLARSCILSSPKDGILPGKLICNHGKRIHTFLHPGGIAAQP